MPIPASTRAARSSRETGTCRRTAGKSAARPSSAGPVDLLEEAAGRAIADAGLDVDDIDAIVVNTITGIAVPSLDALLINRMKFRPDIERLPIFGFGCGGGVAGLSRAARLATAMPDANVLFLTIDLCSICLRVNDPGVEMSRLGGAVRRRCGGHRAQVA